jgi:hypothetical protein
MKNESEVRYSLSTEEFAKLAMVKPQSITASLCSKGSYHGVVPRKLPSGRLAWPENAQELLFAVAEKKAQRKPSGKPKVRHPTATA